MDIYREILIGLKTLLESVEDKFGLPQIVTAIDDWDKTKNHRGLNSYFHKEGLNELFICSANGHKIDEKYITIVNSLFRYYLRLYFSYDPIRGEIDSCAFQDNDTRTMISAWRCFNCGYAIWDKRSIENYVYDRYLGRICKNYIETGRFADFADYKKIYDEYFLHSAIYNIIKILPLYEIEYKLEFKYFQNCPECDTYDNGVYRWDLFYDENNIGIAEREDNLKIKQ